MAYIRSTMSPALHVRRRTAAPSRRARTVTFGAAVAAGAVAGGALSSAGPTGIAEIDVVWSAVLVAGAAFFSGTARRWTWFLPAGIAAVLSGDGVVVASAGLAIVVGLWSVVRDTRSRARGAVVGALGCVALLRADPIGFHGLTALLGAAALAPVVVSGYAHAGRRMRRRVRRVVTIAGVGAGLMVAGALIGLVSVQRDLARGAHAIDQGLSAARDADDDLAAERLGTAARHLTSADSTLSSWFVSPARALPVIGPNLSAAGSLAHRAGDVAEVSSLAAVEADVDALRFLDGRLDPQAVADLEEPLQQIVDALEATEESVGEVGSPWLVAPVAERMGQLERQVDDAMPDAELAATLVRIGPDMLGANGPRRYLVLFVTPVEARGRIGFPGNFAEILFDDGRMTMPRFGRISELERGGTPGTERTLSGPPDMVARYSRFDIAATWRNLTMSPDFPSVALAAGELYPQSGGRPIDGVMSVDPRGLEGLLRYTGPVTVDGLDKEITSENAAGFLLFEQYLAYSDTAQRIDILEEVARTTFENLTRADLPGPRALSDAFDPIVDGGHIQFAPYDQTSFLVLTSLGITGYVGAPEGDAVGLISANAGGSKIDLFLERHLRYDARWDPATGDVTGTLRATLTNDAPSSGLPDYIIGNSVGLPPGTNRSYVSLYSALELEAARVDGQPASMQSERELERNVYSTFVSIPPGETVTIELDLVGSIDGRRYDLDLAQQVMVRADQAEITVEVAGDDALSADGFDLDRRTARWNGAVETPLSLAVAATSGD